MSTTEAPPVPEPPVSTVPPTTAPPVEDSASKRRKVDEATAQVGEEKVSLTDQSGDVVPGDGEDEKNVPTTTTTAQPPKPDVPPPGATTAASSSVLDSLDESLPWEQVKAELEKHVDTLNSRVAEAGAAAAGGDEGVVTIRAMLTNHGPRKVVNVPNPKVGLIIGKSGTTFRQIQDESGAQLFIPDESAPGCPYREITIQGEATAVARCECAILSRISGRPWSMMPPSRPQPRAPAYNAPAPAMGGGMGGMGAMGGMNSMQGMQNMQGMQQAQAMGATAGQDTYSFNVPNEVVGIIIGRQGTTFRQLQEGTGCNITIPKDSLPGTNYRTITLRGTRIAMELCHQQIMSRIEPAIQKSGNVAAYNILASNAQPQANANAAAWAQQGYAYQQQAGAGYDAQAQAQAQAQYAMQYAQQAQGYQ
eukprot:m.89363 g.89363  ORF g.89363 m.89363 type:complete len:420 (+) comp13214_c2_seq1:118-1377(+)